MPENQANFEVEKEDQEITSNSTAGNRLDHRDKVVLAIIGGLGVGVLLLGYLQLTFNIKNAFRPQDFKAPEGALQAYSGGPLNTLGQELEVSEELKLKDTDNDGLSDYDELKIYRTSPYLDDSDSDGISDRQELETGTDPNCPEGKTCRQGAEGTTKTEIPLFSATLQSGDASGASLEAELRQALPIEKLREILISQGGLTKEQVDQIDDATLRQIYEQTLKDINNKSSQ